MVKTGEANWSPWPGGATGGAFIIRRYFGRGVVLGLAAIMIYVLSDDLSWRPHAH